mmetsp:Transcript_55019/g.178838  ORF Transcript_55019/g.178838 Transcript_55019/m.178838 type:complete len:99 (+) Transcript_55019:1419-1715(+)
MHARSCSDDHATLLLQWLGPPQLWLRWWPSTAARRRPSEEMFKLSSTARARGKLLLRGLSTTPWLALVVLKRPAVVFYAHLNAQQMRKRGRLAPAALD